MYKQKGTDNRARQLRPSYLTAKLELRKLEKKCLIQKQITQHFSNVYCFR